MTMMVNIPEPIGGAGIARSLRGSGTVSDRDWFARYPLLASARNVAAQIMKYVAFSSWMPKSPQ